MVVVAIGAKLPFPAIVSATFAANWFASDRYDGFAVTVVVSVSGIGVDCVVVSVTGSALVDVDGIGELVLL